MASQTKTQHPTNQSGKQHTSQEPRREPRMPMMAMVSHGQGQVRNPDTDRRLKANRV